ncbi:MAG: TolC family protein, partial [Zavarzinella sp.]|nr:TolC family protein [Zavarzinella sp.]
AVPARAQPESEFAADRAGSGPAALSLPAAVAYALENNPALAAQRRQRGIAAARVVIADTYPFNPTLETRVQRASGPPEAGILNRTPVEALFLWEVEVRGQRQIRREGAAAGLSRTEWEVAAAEQALAVQVIKAYGAFQYRKEKLRLLEETLQFNERLVEDVRRLVEADKLKSADLIVARTEVAATLNQVNAGRVEEATARQDLYRALGAVDAKLEPAGPFEPAAWAPDAATLSELAATRRADLQARKLAVTEAAAAVRLANANRYGNPIVGAAYTYDPTRITMIGPQVNLPLPLANTNRGQVFQAEVEHALAADTLRQTEVTVRQDVSAALARLAATERQAEQFRTRVLPELRQAVADMEKLFQAGQQGVDLLRVIDVRRKLLQARDGYLDAVWAVRQARADLAAAVGEPALGLVAPEPAPKP